MPRPTVAIQPLPPPPLTIRCPLCGTEVAMLIGASGCASCLGWRVPPNPDRRAGIIVAIQTTAAARADIPPLGGGCFAMLRTFADDLLASLHRLLGAPAKTGAP